MKKAFLLVFLIVSGFVLLKFFNSQDAVLSEPLDKINISCGLCAKSINDEIIFVGHIYGLSGYDGNGYVIQYLKDALKQKNPKMLVFGGDTVSGLYADEFSYIKTVLNSSFNPPPTPPTSTRESRFFSVTESIYN